MKRRTALTAGIAAVAAVAGVSLGMRTLRQASSEPDAAQSAPSSAAATDLSDLWSLRFERPEGGELVLRRLLGRPTLVNFWATWCPPCVKELPLLDAFHAASGDRGFQVVGLAVDGPTPVREFLARAPVRFPIGLAGLDGVAIGRALGNTTGALPFTVICDAAGRVLDRKLGELTSDDLARWRSQHGA